MSRLPLDGAVNARDLGGLPAADGRTTASGRLLRADALASLTDPDLELLARLGLRTAIDFRGPAEVEAGGPDRLPAGTTAIALPIEAGDLGTFVTAFTSGDLRQQADLLGEGKAARFMLDMNRQFVADPEYRAQFGRALHLIADPDRQPALFNCTAGKDRTGWMAAVVLTALGVPPDVVLADYLASNEFVWPAYQPMVESLAQAGQLADPELLKPLLVQDPAYLLAAFDEAESRYGGFGSFLADGLGFGPADVKRLRGSLLRLVTSDT